MGSLWNYSEALIYQQIGLISKSLILPFFSPETNLSPTELNF